MAELKVKRLNPQVLAWEEMFLVCWRVPIQGECGYLVEARMPKDLDTESKMRVTKALNEHLKILFGTERVVMVAVEEGLTPEEVRHRMAKYPPAEILPVFAN